MRLRSQSEVSLASRTLAQKQVAKTSVHNERDKMVDRSKSEIRKVDRSLELVYRQIDVQFMNTCDNQPNPVSHSPQHANSSGQEKHMDSSREHGPLINQDLLHPSNQCTVVWEVDIEAIGRFIVDITESYCQVTIHI